MSEGALEIKSVAPEFVADTVVASILTYAAENPVLFLVSGGSAIPLEAQIIRRLDAEKTAHGITVGQVDERYGTVNHEHANWPRLISQVGDIENITLLPILQGVTRVDTVHLYEKQLRAFQNTYVVALFGMGLDGHTAGILPHSAAASEEEKWVTSYEGHDFERITITPAFIKVVDSGFLFAQGSAKLPLLKDLLNPGDALLHPVQNLKNIPSLTIFHIP